MSTSKKTFWNNSFLFSKFSFILCKITFFYQEPVTKQKKNPRNEYFDGCMIFWRQRLGADVLEQMLTRQRFGAETVWRREV